MNLHDADEVVGRITRNGTFDRRYRIRYEQPEPVEVDLLREWATILGQAALLIVLLGSVIAFSAILAAAQTLPPVPR